MKLERQGQIVLDCLRQYAPSIQLKAALDLAQMFQDAWDQHRTDSEALAILAGVKSGDVNEKDWSPAIVAAWEHAFFRYDEFTGELDILEKWKGRKG